YWRRSYIALYMSAANIDKQISTYLELLNPKQKQAVLSVVKTFAENGAENDFWEDKDFVAEVDRRTSEYEAGKARVLSLDELEAGARKP
ncbi:MAG: hypothetical protein JST68_01985, partial [Bacteroidetes bacterium]|nr:hypothetical protein [Bacteroidota bacterium]